MDALATIIKAASRAQEQRFRLLLLPPVHRFRTACIPLEEKNPLSLSLSLSLRRLFFSTALEAAHFLGVESFEAGNPATKEQEEGDRSLGRGGPRPQRETHSSSPGKQLVNAIHQGRWGPSLNHG